MMRGVDQLEVMARSLLRDTVAIEVASAFSRTGIRCILLKGAAIATWLYDDGALRWYSDTDLLVAPADFRRAERELRNLGFGPAKVGWSVYELERHAHPWTRAQETVDLHHRLWGVPLAPAEAWTILGRDTELLPIGGGTVEVLAPPARALHVALNVVHDGPRHTKAREDLVRAGSRVSEQTWREAAELAQVLGVAGLMAAGLRVDPATAPLCGRLGLPESTGPRARLLLARDAPHSAISLADALTADTWRAKLAAAARLAIPTPAWVRAHYSFACRGRAALTACYVWRVATVIRRAPAAVAALARTRR